MKKLLYFLMAGVIFLASACGGGNAPYDLRTENLIDPLAIETSSPALSWKIPALEGGNSQTAYHIVAASDPRLLAPGKADLWDSGRVESDESVLVSWGGKPLDSRSQVWWKVKTWDAAGGESSWSPVASLGIGLIEPGDWSGSYIGLDSLEGEYQSPMLRSGFIAGKAQRHLLHVNSLGYHEVYLNGAKVGDAVLAPAVSQTGTRSLAVTYDLSDLVRKGDNDLVLWLGQGWYRPGLPGVVYPGALVRAQVETFADGKWSTVLATGVGWKARPSAYTGTGSWRMGDFGGEVIDGSKMLADMTSPTLDAVEWSNAVAVDVPAHKVSPQMAELNTVIETLKAISVTAHGDEGNAWMVDLGRPINGLTTIQFRDLAPGREIVMRYGDHIAANGLPGQRFEDRYIARGVDGETFENRFNHHAYRYILISGLDTAPAPEDITGRLISTGYRDASSFECSDADMNAIHDMVQYTLKCLTWGGYMVDCAHIERLGYGGDGHGSTVTANTMFDMHALYTNWLHAWNDSQRPDGWLPHVAPNPYRAGGGPYWCAFIVAAPWEMYLAYGDKRILEEYYPKMQLWMDYVKAYTIDGMLTEWPEDGFRHWFLGDWATPTPPRGSWRPGMPVTPPVVNPRDPGSISLVANCVVSESLGTMAKIALILGRRQDAANWTAWKDQTDRLIHANLYDEATGSYASGSQIDQAYPMLVGATPVELLPTVRESMMNMTAEKLDGHLGAGLVGIPVLVDWAVRNREVDFMYGMLKKRDFPGYLYMMDNSDTGDGPGTTWEHWNGQRSRLHNCYNGIGSWFYNAIGGLHTDGNSPGWRHSVIDIQIPSEGITWARTSKETPYGTLSVDWSLEGKTVSVKATVPPGCTSEVILPAGKDPVPLASGNHSLSYDLP